MKIILGESGVWDMGEGTVVGVAAGGVAKTNGDVSASSLESLVTISCDPKTRDNLCLSLRSFSCDPAEICSLIDNCLTAASGASGREQRDGVPEGGCSAWGVAGLEAVILEPSSTRDCGRSRCVCSGDEVVDAESCKGG